MKCDWQNEVHMECFTHAKFVPPAMFDEPAWDCLLALHADARHELNLDQLAWLISVPAPSLQRCLVNLERQRFVIGEQDERNGELRAVLTRSGRDLLERYLSATSALQFRR
ncbi:hypothetical protein OVY29_22635 [Sphingopyxis sp. SE2]|uniref:hypothetical protein n=1 Tax=Sphingopyxis sp. SE2 TaxID=1586240 RepID=UPI0028C32131|nr:hypothetical protein [Sphingopyxis sp. SE2]MDT7531458.1 hypothetical protein [Sphingopyxis sp. SE2]